MVEAKVEAVVDDGCWRGWWLVVYTWRRRVVSTLTVMRWPGQTARGPDWSMAFKLVLTDIPQRWPMGEGEVGRMAPQGVEIEIPPVAAGGGGAGIHG